MIKSVYKTRQQDLLLAFLKETKGSHFTAEDTAMMLSISVLSLASFSFTSMTSGRKSGLIFVDFVIGWVCFLSLQYSRNPSNPVLL